MVDRRTFLRNTIISTTGFIFLPQFSFNEEKAADFDIVDDLEQGFSNPPITARPQAYWMWMNGHITKQGITLDLETMKDLGLAGAFIYNTGTGIPKGPIAYGSNEWDEMLTHA